MKIAGVLQTKNYKDTYKTISTLRDLTDFVIVLDDNSITPLNVSGIDVLISVKHNQIFNCLLNRTILHYYAWANQCEWILQMDDDFILSKALRSPDVIKNIINECIKLKNADIISVELRDLWDGFDYYRCDGIWGKKIFSFLQRVWFGDQNITLKNPQTHRLHSDCFPSSKIPIVHHLERNGPYAIYHTGCINESSRIKRVNNYKKWDNENEFQSDYSYMLDKTGSQLKPVCPEDKWQG